MCAEATSPVPPVRRRGRPRIDLRRLGHAALRGPAPRHPLPDAIEHVAKVHRAHHPGADLDPLRRAYLLAESSHRGQTRKSGEPYITHPLAVTLILAELGAETTTLTASLLHDTVEDTEVTLEQVGEEFGEEVRYLVDGVTKLEKVDYGAAAEPETFRKMLVATGNDVRVMSVKLADRLHNMRTLGVMRPEKQARIARVTRDVLIPLAERLGVHALKTELEDLVFAVLHPEAYERTRRLVRDRTARPGPLEATAERVRAVLREADIAAEVHIRPRHLVSVHRVRLGRGERGELTAADFGRLLVLVAEDADCYAVLGELHTCFTPVVSRFKDFIAAPKFNLYQSLHTAVVARREGGEVTEVLVRTHRMHRVAEAGVVALGNPYTADGQDAAEAPEGERTDPTRPGWLSRLLDWQRDTPDPDTFWDSLREELAEDREITVCEAGGATVVLPAGASCVDAAYALHGGGAHSCIGARVNGRLVSLASVLRDGDTLQLLMAQDGASGPSPEWLDCARTPAARIAISGWLAAHPAAAAREAARSRPAGPAEPDPSGPAPGPPGGGPAGGCRVTLLAEAFGRPRLLAELTEAIAQQGAAVVSARVEPPHEQCVRHTYTLRLAGPAGLPALVRAMRRVPGVYDVSRVGAPGERTPGADEDEGAPGTDRAPRADGVPPSGPAPGVSAVPAAPEGPAARPTAGNATPAGQPGRESPARAGKPG